MTFTLAASSSSFVFGPSSRSTAASTHDFTAAPSAQRSASLAFFTRRTAGKRYRCSTSAASLSETRALTASSIWASVTTTPTPAASSRADSSKKAPPPPPSAAAAAAGAAEEEEEEEAKSSPEPTDAK